MYFSTRIVLVAVMAAALLSPVVSAQAPDPEEILVRASALAKEGRHEEALAEISKAIDLLRRSQANAPVRPPATPGEEPVVRVVNLREVQAAALSPALSALTYAWKLRNVNVTSSFDSLNNVVLSGDKTAVEAVAAEIAKLDQPPVDFTLRVYLLHASNQSMGTGDGSELGKEVTEVVDYLKGVVPFKSYQLLNGGLLRMQEKSPGRLTLGGPQNYFEIRFQPAGANRERATVRLSDIEMEQTILARVDGKDVRQQRVILRSSVQLRDGEVAVLGASRVDGTEEALVLLVKCEFVK